MKKYKVLVIDDDETTLKLLQRSVEKAGFIPLAAKSGNEGLKLFKSNRPALVIVDQMMPDLKGTQVLNKIKKMAPETVRVMATSSTDAQVMRDAINTGEVFRFLKKPVDVPSAQTVVQEGIRQYESRLKTQSELKEALEKATQVKFLGWFAALVSILLIFLVGLFAYLSMTNKNSSSREAMPQAVPSKPPPPPEEPKTSGAGESESPEVKEARVLMRAGDYPTAIEKLTGLHNDDPENTGIINLLAEASVYSKRTDDAGKWAKMSLEIDPHQGEPHAVLGRILFLRGLFDQAQEETRKALIRDTRLVLPYRTIGEIYLRKKRFEDALNVLKTADHLEPGRVQIINLLATTYLKMKLFGKALKEGKRALKLDPEFPGTHFNLALCYYHLGEGKNAIKHINLAEKFYLNEERFQWVGKTRHTKKTIMKKFQMHPEDVNS